MKDLTALPNWWGMVLIILAALFSFPAVGMILEAHNSELWKVKSDTMGMFYPEASLIWSYFSILGSAVFLGIGIDVIRKADPDNHL